MAAVLRTDPTGVVALAAGELSKHSGRSTTVANLAVMSRATTFLASHFLSFS